MSRRMLLALLLALVPARAWSDALVYSDGETVRGTVVGITLQTEGSQGIYPRGRIRSVDLSVAGPDVVRLKSGAPRTGKVIGVQFRTEHRVLRVPREKLSIISITEAPEPTKETPKPEGKKSSDDAQDTDAPAKGTPEKEGRATPPPVKPKGDVSPEEKQARKAAVAKAFALRNHFYDRAEEIKEKEVNSLKAQYKEHILGMLREIKDLEETIRRKEREREDLSREWRHRRDDNYRQRRRPDLVINDNLEKDRKALKELRRQKLELQKTIRGAMAKIDERLVRRRDQVGAAFSRLKRAIEAGKDVSEAEMRSAFQAAVGTAEVGFEAPGPMKGALEPEEKKKAPEPPKK